MKPLPKNSSARRAVLAASIAGLVAHTAHADLTWNSSGPTNNWSTTAGETNWLPSSVVWTQNENAIFNAGAETVTVSTPITVNDITFGVTGFVIADGAGLLSLANDFASTITVTNSGETATIAEVIGNNGSTASALTKAGAGTLVLSGSNSYTGGTSVTGGTLSVGASANLGTGTAVTLNGGGLAITANTQTFAQNFSIGAGGGSITVPSASQTGTLSGVFTGAGQLTFNGTGSTNVSGANSGLSGGVVINAGRIQITTNGNALGTGAVTVNGSGGSGGQLFGTAVTLANNFTLSGFGGNAVDGVQRGALRLDGGTLNGTVTLAADAGIGANSTSTATINGVINAAGFNFRKSDTGTVNLSAANLNFGDITIGTNGQAAGGTLGITGSGSLNGGTYSGTITSGTSGTSATFNYASSTNQTLSGNMTGVVSLTKSGNSTLTLAGAHSRAGATTVNAGTLKLDYGASDTAKLGTGVASILNLGGGILELSGGSYVGEAVASTTLTAGPTSLIVSTNGSTAVLNLNAITRNAGATVILSNDGIATTDTPNTNGILGAWATIGQSNWAMNSTNGPDGLITTYTAYTDVTRLSSGDKIIANDATLNVRIVEGTGTAGDLTLAAGTTTINTLNHSTQGGTGNATVAMGGNTLVVNGVLVAPGSGSLTFGSTANDGVIKSSGTDVTLMNHSSNGVIVNSAVVDGAGASSLTKTGTGTVTLNGTNTYTGATTISAGTLVIGGAASLGSGGVYAGSISDTGVLQYSSSANQTLSGIISGAGSLVKDGTGTLTLSGSANTYTGGTTINGGTLIIGNANKLGGATSIAAGATLNWVAAGSQNLTNALSGAGLLQIDLSGGVSNAVLTAGTGFTGTIRISAPGGSQGNKVQITAGNGQNADVIVDANAQLFAGTGTGGTIKSLSLVGTGNSENRGALRLGSNLTVTNGVTLQGNANIGTETGTLTGNIAGSATTGNTHTLTLGGTTGAGNSTFNGIIGDGTNGGSLALIVASATQTLAGINTFTGGITIQGNATAAVNSIGIAGSSGNLGNGAVKLGSVATAGTISYAGAGETTDRVLNLTGTTGGAGITHAGTGLLKFTSDLAIPGTAAADNRKTFTLSNSNSGAGEFAGRIVDSAQGTAGQLATSVSKTGNGTWTLSGNNSYTGTTAISGGTLAITGSGSLGGGTYAGVISGAGALTFDTSTIQTLSGANTHTGAMTVNSGKVIVTNQGASNSSAYTVVSGATLEMNVASGTRTMATGSTFSGGGTFIKSGTGILQWGTATGNFAFGSGALIDVQGGQFTGGSNGNEVWTNNKADLNVAAGATFDAVEATTVANGGVFVDALTGDGTIKVGFGTPGQYASKISFGVDNGSGVFNGVLADSAAAGNYIKAGSGTQTLTGTNTYTGTTTVNGGVLRVNGANNGTGAFTVNASGTLGGTGTIAGPVSISGTLAPGASVESLRTGAASFLGGSTLAVELDSSAPGAFGADLLVANGALSLTGTVNLTLTDLAGSPTAFAGGTTFTLINYGGSAVTSGLSFNNIPLADGDTFTAGLTMWQIDYNALTEGVNFTADTDQTNFVNLIAVPEPASAASLLGGLGILLGFQRSRRSRRNEV